MIDGSKEFYRNELDLMYEILNKIEKSLQAHPDNREFLELKDVALFRISLLEKILATFIN